MTLPLLRQRVASALALAVVVIAACIYLPAPWLAAFLLLLVLVAVREWAKLSGIETRAGFVAYAVLMAAVVAGLWLAPQGWRHGFLHAVVILWIAAIVVVWKYPASGRLFASVPRMAGIGLFVIPGTWLALVELAVLGGGRLVIWFLAAVAAGDIGAYFAGRRFGRTKLAPSVSPGKTLEGAWGGGVTALGWGVVGAWYFVGGLGAVVPWLGAVAVIFGAGILGDLFESAFKRSRGVKDSGAILPGHGGILDRVDAVLAAAPAFALIAAGLPGLVS